MTRIIEGLEREQAQELLGVLLKKHKERKDNILLDYYMDAFNLPEDIKVDDIYYMFPDLKSHLEPNGAHPTDVSPVETIGNTLYQSEDNSTIVNLWHSFYDVSGIPGHKKPSQEPVSNDDGIRLQMNKADIERFNEYLMENNIDFKCYSKSGKFVGGAFEGKYFTNEDDLDNEINQCQSSASFR